MNFVSKEFFKELVFSNSKIEYFFSAEDNAEAALTAQEKLQSLTSCDICKAAKEKIISYLPEEYRELYEKAKAKAEGIRIVDYASKVKNLLIFFIHWRYFLFLFYFKFFGLI